MKIQAVGREIIRVKKKGKKNEISNLLYNISVKSNFLCHGSRLDKDRVIRTYEKPSSSEQTSPLDLTLV